MGTEDALTPAASALYSMSRVVASSSCVITHPIGEAWALIREWGSCPWLAELDGRPYRAHLLDGTCDTAVGARRVVHIGEQRMFERLTAVDDEEHILKWRLISHADTINPFLASLVNHESKIKLTPIALGNQTLIEWRGSFYTEPQHAPSMKSTFCKLYIQGFMSLQAILRASAVARSRSVSEGSEAGVPNGRAHGDRGSSLGSTASASLGSRADSHQSKSSSLGSMNGDRDNFTAGMASKYAQAYPRAGQPLNSMQNLRGTSLETIPADRQLPMEDLAIRSNSEPEAGISETKEDAEKVHESSPQPEPSDGASPSSMDAWAPPTSHAIGSSGGSFGSSAGSFTFNDQLLVPTSSLGPALNGFAKSSSLPLSSTDSAPRGSPGSPMYKIGDPSSETLALLRSKQQSPGNHLRPGGLVRSGSESKCFTDEACQLARLNAQDMQRISDAFQRSQSLGTNAYLHKIPASQFPAQAGQATMGFGVRSAELPPLNRMPRAAEPALDRGANMLMPQVYDSRGSNSSGAASEKSLNSLNRSGSGRVSLDHWSPHNGLTARAAEGIDLGLGRICKQDLSKSKSTSACGISHWGN